MTIKRAKEIMSEAVDSQHWIWLINKEQRCVMKIKVTGFFSALHKSTPMEVIQEMLRYDQGIVLDIQISDPIPHTYRSRFMAVVDVKKYTPERWDSFGLKTNQLDIYDNPTNE